MVCSFFVYFTCRFCFSIRRFCCCYFVVWRFSSLYIYIWSHIRNILHFVAVQCVFNLGSFHFLTPAHSLALSIPLLVSLGKFYACFQHKIGYSFCEQTRSAVVLLLLLLFFPLLFSCSLALRYSHMNVKSNIFYKASNPSTCTYILLIMQEFLISGGQTTKKIEQNERKRTTWFHLVFVAVVSYQEMYVCINCVEYSPQCLGENIFYFKYIQNTWTTWKLSTDGKTKHIAWNTYILKCDMLFWAYANRIINQMQK